MVRERKPLVMSPLADPVINATFSSVETAGLAAESLIRAILEGSGDPNYPRIGKLTKVTPQRHYSKPYQRGARIDVEGTTDANEFLLMEFQLSLDKVILQRNLFSAARVITAASKQGDTHIEMAEKIPHVISIDILNYVSRHDNKDVIQPARHMYLKCPKRVALEQFATYEVQLPLLDGMKPAFDKPWYCWLYALYEAHKKQTDLRKVIEMTPELKTFAKSDPGFGQYVNLYENAAVNPNVTGEYSVWWEDYLRFNGERISAEMEQNRLNAMLAEERAKNERQAAIIAEGRAERERQAAIIAKLLP